MKVKRFDNLWTMGLILTGAILVLFYIAKIFFPEFIVGVAEIPSIVKFGNYVDSHKWAHYLYNFSIGFLGGYIYCCACCRVKTLTKKQTLMLVGFLLLGIALQVHLSSVYLSYNFVFIVFMPFCMLWSSKGLGEETFISTVICFTIDIMAQALSSVIKDIVLVAPCINSAIMTILLIDIWIWRILLYLFFNNKNKKEC